MKKKICELIRNDMVEDFVTYMEKHCCSVNSCNDESIFETNRFLIINPTIYYSSFDGRKYSLIEYAAFFGSIKIFNYLQNNGAELKPSLWDYVIHSNNAELISIVDEKVEIE